MPRLYLVGGGDPTLGTGEYRRRRFLPPPGDPAPVPVFASGSPTVEQLAARIRAAGVRRVGRLVVDASLFDDRRTAPGWPRRYLEEDPDVALLDALTINEGFTDARHDALLQVPSLAAGRALAAALSARGVRVGTLTRGRAPRSAAEVARVESPPLSEIVFYINRWSPNYPAEMLLKALGARFGGAGTTAAGAKVVRETLSSLGIPTEGLVMADGSGLSLLNRITPRTLAGIVEHILAADGTGGQALRRSLPIAGRPGTLLRRMPSTPAVGNLRGKTGLLRGVRNMAGWSDGADGTPLVYVAMFNRARSAAAMTRPLDLIGIAVTLFPLL